MRYALRWRAALDKVFHLRLGLYEKSKGPFTFLPKKTACFQKQAVYWKQAVFENELFSNIISLSIFRRRYSVDGQELEYFSWNITCFDSRKVDETEYVESESENIPFFDAPQGMA